MIEVARVVGCQAILSDPVAAVLKCCRFSQSLAPPVDNVGDLDLRLHDADAFVGGRRPNPGPDIGTRGAAYPRSESTLTATSLCSLGTS